jgi:hypothetical protein
MGTLEGLQNVDLVPEKLKKLPKNLIWDHSDGVSGSTQNHKKKY